MVDEEKKETISAEVEEKNAKSKEKLFKVIGAIVSVVILIILIVIKSQKPEFPLFWFVGGIIFLLIFFLAMWFGFSIYRKYQEAVEKEKSSKELPPAITLEQADALIRELLQRPNYADYSCGWDTHKVYVIGEHIKSRVLLVKLSPTPYSSAPYQFIAMNLHYPKELYSFITQVKLNTSEISRIVNSLACDPVAEPDTERRIETDLLTGKKIEYVKKQVHKKHKEETKKEDLD